MSDRAHVAWQLRDQAASCAAMDSPLYAGLLEGAAKDAEAAARHRRRWVEMQAASRLLALLA